MRLWLKTIKYHLNIFGYPFENNLNISKIVKARMAMRPLIFNDKEEKLLSGPQGKSECFWKRKRLGEQAMKFEKENRRIKMLWFKYDTITAVLTMSGLVTICFQKYLAILRLKNECLEFGFDYCHKRMTEERYEYNDLFAYIVMSLNFLSLITFLIGQKYKVRWF